MSTPTATLVVTTIFDPALLDDYYENFRKFGHLDQVQVIVIPDRKTPAATYIRCQALAKRGLKTLCPNIEEQEQFMNSIGLAANAIPYNSDNRRNVGYLMAYGNGTDFLISIDDDNYCQPDEDVFSEHAVVTQPESACHVLESATGFFNICDLLEFENPGPVYARGFPYYRRHLDETPRSEGLTASVHVNAGLWLFDPDIDGITWLVNKPKVRAFNGTSVVLGRQTWSPINSQNTALIRAAIPSYYFLRMGYPLGGMPIDRYGDIFSGYFLLACAKHMGAMARVGTPVAEHRRNSHNYMKDAANEWTCIVVLEDLLPWLTEFRPEGSTYVESFRSLSFGIQDAVERFTGSVWTDVTRAYFHQTAYHMRAWLKACETIAGAQ